MTNGGVLLQYGMQRQYHQYEWSKHSQLLFQWESGIWENAFALTARKAMADVQVERSWRPWTCYLSLTRCKANDDHLAASPMGRCNLYLPVPGSWCLPDSFRSNTVHNNSGGDNGEDGSGVQGREVHGQHCRKWVPVFQKVQISGRFIEVRGSGSLDHWGICNPWHQSWEVNISLSGLYIYCLNFVWKSKHDMKKWCAYKRVISAASSMLPWGWMRNFSLFVPIPFTKFTCIIWQALCGQPL